MIAVFMIFCINMWKTIDYIVNSGIIRSHFMKELVIFETSVIFDLLKKVNTGIIRSQFMKEFIIFVT